MILLLLVKQALHLCDALAVQAAGFRLQRGSSVLKPLPGALLLALLLLALFFAHILARSQWGHLHAPWTATRRRGCATPGVNKLLLNTQG